MGWIKRLALGYGYTALYVRANWEGTLLLARLLPLMDPLCWPVTWERLPSRDAPL